jgi:predicted NodU family carbamoyl transferase
MSATSSGQQPVERAHTGYVLGLNLGFHESSAALLHNGSLRWLVEQERLSRRKRALGQSPAGAARACLAAEGVALESVDAIAIGWDFSRTPLGRSRRFTDEGLRQLLFPEAPPDQMPPVRWVPHHLAHAACAFYSSGETEAAVLVVDGAGETQATTLARACAGGVEILREWPMAQSLGFFYASASKWAGLGEWGAGKLMGLAAYGRPQPGLPLRCVDGGYVLDLDVAPDPPSDGRRPRPPMMSFPPAYEAAVAAAFAEHFPYAPRAGEDAMSYADLAASVQRETEEAMLALAAEARRLVDVPALVLAGGVAMNCSMVGRMIRECPFERVFVPPVPTDAGVALGGALVVARELGSPESFAPTRIDHPYWSLGIDLDSACEAVRAAGLVARRLPDEQLAGEVAQALAAGRIVAVARGRAEIGQRALGARSIVADPRDRRTHERLNVIKGREMWRPVAPSILREHIGELMEGTVGDPARFMLAASSVRPSQRTRVPAITHVDGSARPHAVDRSSNPFYWSLIDRFRQLTGVPAVVNTSFNLAGEPIVCSAEDAVSTFVRAEGIDLLVLDELLVTR